MFSILYKVIRKNELKLVHINSFYIKMKEFFFKYYFRIIRSQLPETYFLKNREISNQNTKNPGVKQTQYLLLHAPTH